MNAPPDAEAARLAVAREYPLVERGADPALFEACRLAKLLCHCPMVAIEFVLEDTVLRAAAVGVALGQIERGEALCARLLAERAIVAVRDARLDPRFSGLRLVQGTDGVRFYAAVPLMAPEGFVVGFLSIGDRVAGELTADHAESLEALGRLVMTQLNLWRRQRQLEELEAQHARVDAALREAEAKFRGIFENTVVGIYQTTAEGRYLSANPMLAQIYGYATPAELTASVGNIERQLYVDPGARERFIAALQGEKTIKNFEAQVYRRDGTVIWIAEDARVVRRASGEVEYYEGTVQDITARKLAEEQLRTSEMLFHSLVEELPQNIFRKDARERFIFANGRFCDTVGRPLQQILGGTDFDLYPGELARKYQEDDQRVMAEGRTVRETERNVTPDGAVHWVEVIKTPLRDVTGQVVGIQGIFWDVTERKRLQDALAEERDLLQALLDHSPDIIYFKDTQSRFVKVGRALARRFNVNDPEELVGKTVLDLWQPEIAHILHAEEQELLRRGQPILNRVEEVVDQQGHRTWASVTKVPIYNRAGEILGLVGVARDISQLIETEQALREAEEKFRTIFENSVEGIFQTSPEGRFLRVNPALARIYGYSSPEEVISHFTDVRTQVYVDPGRREEFVRLVLEKGSITGFESEIYRKDGTTTWISESARTVKDREGRLAFFEGTLEDISARKQIEKEQEKARQAALDSVRVKSEFVATVSHEIRTPLNAILPNTELLLDTRLDRQQRSLVESIDHGARMLLQIVNDILTVSKIEAGAVTLEDIDFDVHELFERTVSFFGSHAGAKQLELIGNIGAGVPQFLRGDPGRLGQILNNLLGNAIKFTETGEVAIEVEAMPAEDAPIELRFRVRDTGIGIAPESRERVFQAFAQADGSMSRRYGGTGLGLAISRRFAELMGGTIDFTSEVGHGTTFRFNVRLHAASAPKPATPPVAAMAGLRVLVLEDNATQRNVITSTLAGLGAVEVLATDTIGDAVERLRNAARAGRPMDLVFFDTELPGSDGLQTARRLRSDVAGSVRLIALTPPGTIADARGLEASGICGTLVKPLRQSRVPLEIASMLKGERGATELEASGRPGDGEREPGRGMEILVVEDNPLNQRVASELLERLGARVDAVSSGPDALTAFERKRYSLVLMDCQMPGMDGYETTRRIREWERSADPSVDESTQVPIVALSANALSGDRDRGLAAGMDDYLTKPLRQPELIRVLRDASGRRRASAPEPPAESSGVAPDETPLLDPAPLEALVSPDDPTVLPEFIEAFLSDAPDRIGRLRCAASQRDAAALRAEAHSLKGSASYMGTRRLVAACARLEEAARASDINLAGTLVSEVESEFGDAREALRAYLDKVQKPA